MTTPLFTDTHSPLEGRSTMSTEQQESTNQNSQQYAIRVTVICPGEPPADFNPVRLVGPYAEDWQVLDAWRVFTRLAEDMLDQITAVVDVVPFDEQVEHLDPRPPVDVEELADILAGDPPCGPLHFPDLRDRLTAAHGVNITQWAWTAALLYSAGLTTDGARERRAEEETDPRLAPCRAAIRAASRARIEPFSPQEIHDATALLADLLDATESHGVNRDEVARQLAPVALDVVAARSAVPA